MDIQYDITDMTRDSQTGIVDSVAVRMYVNGTSLSKELVIGLGAPSGVPIPYADLDQATVKSWLYSNRESLKSLTEASKDLQRQHNSSTGLPWA